MTLNQYDVLQTLQVPSVEEVEKGYENLTKCVDTFLFASGVRMPPLFNSSGRFQSNALQLAILYLHREKLVPKDYIGKVVTCLRGGSSDQQPRHLAKKGFDILCSGKNRGTLRADTVDLLGGEYEAGERMPDGMYILYPTTVSPQFKLNTRKSGFEEALTDDQWENVKNIFDFKCGMCHRAVALEKGHLDPTKPLTEANVGPLCCVCNNWVSDRWILKKDNHRKMVYVIGPANASFIKDCSEEVILAIAATPRIRKSLGKK